MAKKISILGSTGSIGTQTLEIADQYKDRLEVVAMSCGRNIKLFEEQIRKFKPQIVSVADEKDAADLSARIKDLNVKVCYGMPGLIEVATVDEVDTVVTAIVGMIGIRPTIAAIEAGKDIALANKETLVCAGHIIMPLAKEKGVKILPVDSEHSAIFQCLQGNAGNDIEKIILTCSGGPFRGMDYDALEKVTVDDALKHPNWNMGNKITIDSATLVNKGLEVMEARWLFGVGLNQIDVTIHPQSVLHSAVEFADGAVMGQMGTPDMKIPIAYALFYPDRPQLFGKSLSLKEIGSLTFEEPDIDTFIGLGLAYDAIIAGGNMPTVYNAANEFAVAKFLNRQCGFTQIYEAISAAMMEVDYIERPSVDDILNTQKMTEEILAEVL